jgi:hypothetical protein
VRDYVDERIGNPEGETFVGRWVNAPDRDAHAGRYYALYATIQLIASVALTGQRR